MRLISLFIILLLVYNANSQQYIPSNGLKQSNYSLIALTNANIFNEDGKLIQNAVIIIENNKIKKIGKNISIPENAVVLDFSNKFILPSFIELNASLNITKPEYLVKKTSHDEAVNQYYWNEAIHPEFDASSQTIKDQSVLNEYIKMGFGIINNHLEDGIARGYSSLIKTVFSSSNDYLIKNQSAAYFSFNKGSSINDYPSSLMGSIALLRQTFYDAIWYSKATKKNINLSLEALNKQINQKLFFVCEDKYDIIRAKKIADEFSLNFQYICKGNEYEIVEELKNNKIQSLVLPLTFPDNYDVSDPYFSKDIQLKDLKHWEYAPYNFKILKSNNFNLALSSFKIQQANDFWKNIHKVLKTGVKQEDVLKALSINPAIFLGIDKDYGSLEEGKMAFFCVYDINPFEKETLPSETWCDGTRKIHQYNKVFDLSGEYNMNIEKQLYKLIITGDDILKYDSKVFLIIEKEIHNTNSKHKNKDDIEKNKKLTDTIYFNSKINKIGDDIYLQIFKDSGEYKSFYTLHGKFLEKHFIFEGDGYDKKGNWIKWTAVKNQDKKLENEIKKVEVVQNDIIGEIWFPNSPFGFKEKPKQEKILIENVTVWTCEKDGVIENANVLVENGKIKLISKNKIIEKVDVTIDGTNKHLTPGIIDEHSHIAISKGVNEGSHSVTSEVRISDVINPEDINIYRQLSGGVTTSQLLHGSANPIGGQSAIIKLKWGFNPDEMLIKDAPKFIKFALGENVKQSNWGDYSKYRFPQTRMGVEQVFFDAFTRAKQYKKDKKANKQDFHVDLELEALTEILDKNRFITCHSYVQSEINMLMHIADSFGFKINTFTHVLEGYKIADKLKKHGSGASTFSDWWAYKFEVNDAIPQNVVLLNKMGLTCAINSDDAEMGRRLNQEAAKSIKYGSLSEQEALKLVTINPATLLHLENRIGSIKIGKDADLVLWSDNPLSINAKVNYTIIDGIIFFSSKTNAELETQNKVEKTRLINKMISENKFGNNVNIKPFVKRQKGSFHCNTIGEEESINENSH